MFAGQVTCIGWLLVTVTVNEQVEVLPAASVALTVTVETPTGNVEPEAGVAVTVTLPQLSVAVGV